MGAVVERELLSAIVELGRRGAGAVVTRGSRFRTGVELARRGAGVELGRRDAGVELVRRGALPRPSASVRV
jgi:hypothetical protein